MSPLTVDLLASEITDDLRARFMRQGFTAKIAPDGRARISVKVRKPCQEKDLYQRLMCYFELRSIPALISSPGTCSFLIILDADEIERMREEERKVSRWW